MREEEREKECERRALLSGFRRASFLQPEQGQPQERGSPFF